jgi:hypothetical protein
MNPFATIIEPKRGGYWNEDRRKRQSERMSKWYALRRDPKNNGNNDQENRKRNQPPLS